MSQETKKDTQTTIGKTSANTGKGIEKAGSVLDKGAKSISRWNDRRHNPPEEKSRPLNLEENASKTPSSDVGATSTGSSNTESLNLKTSTDAKESSSVVGIKTNVPTKNEETKIEDRSSKQEKSVNENVAKTDMKAKPLKEGTSDSKNENSSLLGIKTLADSKNTKTSHSQQNKESALQGIKTQQTSTADVEGATGAEGASPSAPKEDGKLKGTVKKVGRFVNKKTFQFEKSQGKISKTATVIGKTAVLSGKAIKGISSTSGKISKIEDEGGGGVQFAQSEMQKKVVKKVSSRLG